MIFSLTRHHDYSIHDIENLIPFERDVYVELIKDYLRQEEEKRKQEQALKRGY